MSLEDCRVQVYGTRADTVKVSGDYTAEITVPKAEHGEPVNIALSNGVVVTLRYEDETWSVVDGAAPRRARADVVAAGAFIDTDAPNHSETLVVESSLPIVSAYEVDKNRV